MKKLICLTLVVVSVLSLSAVAFASVPATPTTIPENSSEIVAVEENSEISMFAAKAACKPSSNHNWEYVHTVFKRVKDWPWSDYRIETYYVYECTKCGATLEEFVG